MANSAAAASDFTSVDKRWVVGAGTLAYGLLLIRTAWVCDDAYITFRTVMNLLHGHGLRWNVVNRVQAYTHPLWMFVMTGAAAVSGEVYFTSIFLSIALSLAVVALVAVRLASSLPMALLALSAFAGSKSFVEYSTSGLENALTHLLLVGFFLAIASVRLKPDTTYPFVLSLLTALLMLNRLDAGVLVLPAFAAEVWRLRGRRPWLPVAAGMLPLLAWELFSLLYYGFLVPNTAYAKLGPGVPRLELVQQGLLYLLDSIGNDPVTLMVILAAAASPLIFHSGWQLPLGIVLYIGFVVWVGGDFMSGRFLSAPFLCAVAYLSRQPIASRFTSGFAVALTVIWIAGLTATRPPLLADSTYGESVAPDESITASHVNDERRYYYPFTGLLAAHRGVSMPNHRWAHLGDEHRRARTRVWFIDEAGFIAYAAGPETTFIDAWGLADPLLARLPAEVPWQIGHFTRRVPAGYEETVASGRNVIKDTAVAAYYEKLRIISEEPIWSRRRLRTILAMNLGGYQSLLDSYGIVRTSLDDVSTPRAAGSPWNAPGNVILTSRGALIAAGRVHEGGRVELSVSTNDTYRVRFLHDDRRVAERMVFPTIGDASGLQLHTFALPSAVRWNAISVAPVDGDTRYSLGHVRLLP